VQQAIAPDFDILHGWDVQGDLAWGIYGASIEAGLGLQFSFVFGMHQAGNCCQI
jgi:hypothetical protein